MGPMCRDLPDVTELLSYQFVKDLVDNVKSEEAESSTRRGSIRVPFRGKVLAVPVIMSDKRPECAVVWLKDASRGGFCVSMKKQLPPQSVVLVGFRESSDLMRARWFRCVVRTVCAERDAFLIGLQILDDFSAAMASAVMDGDVDAMLAVGALGMPFDMDNGPMPHA